MPPTFTNSGKIEKWKGYKKTKGNTKGRKIVKTEQKKVIRNFSCCRKCNVFLGDALSVTIIISKNMEKRLNEQEISGRIETI